MSNNNESFSAKPKLQNNMASSYNVCIEALTELGHETHPAGTGVYFSQDSKMALVLFYFQMDKYGAMQHGIQYCAGQRCPREQTILCRALL